MSKAIIFRNASVTAVQVLWNAVALFVLYRYLIAKVGVEKIGLWSLVTAITSIAPTIYMGFSSGITRFVAKYAALKDEPTVCGLIETALLMACTLLVGLLVLVFGAGYFLLQVLVPPEHLAEARALLPLTLTGLWFGMLSEVYQSSLTGLQLVAEAKVVLIISSVIYVGVALLLVPDFGLHGVVVGFLVQAAASALGGMLLLKRALSPLALIPHRWDATRFREFGRYGSHLQANFISEMLMEPVTKAVLSMFGGLAMVGYYDIASRMLLIIRGVVVLPTQTLVPVVSEMAETRPDEITNFYKRIAGFMVFLCVPGFGLVICSAPVISWIWFAHDEPLFDLFWVIVALGWIGNALSSPAYVVDLGRGKLKRITRAGLAMLAVNALLGGAGAALFGGEWATVAWSLARWTAALILILSYHSAASLSTWDVFARGNRGLLVASVAGVLLAWGSADYLMAYPDSKPLLYGSLQIVVFSFIALAAMWPHELRSRITTLVTGRFFGRQITPAR